MTAATDVAGRLTTRVLKGWLEIPNRRVAQNLRFFRLRGYRDRDQQHERAYQLISRHGPTSELAVRLNRINAESCVAVKVTEIQRPKKAQRVDQGEIGQYEYEIHDIEVLNEAVQDLPFLPNEESGVDNAVRSQYRHIEMRSSRLGNALRERARLRTQLRRQLESQGFLEVETPLLFKSTPEGAREFLVPTRRKGQFFALPQSPQQYKQILMAGGIHRYYQFAKCFRDEDSRADRQLEFTQLDLEMAFVEMEDVMGAISKVVLSIDDGAPFNVQDRNIQCLRYQDAMSLYGSDKPDLRFEMHIQSIATGTDTVDFIQVDLPADKTLTNKMYKTLQQSLKEYSVYAIMRRSDSVHIPELFADVKSRLPDIPAQSLLLLSRRPTLLTGGSTAMGQARLTTHSFLTSHEFMPPLASRPFELCWITDFPLFSPSTPGEPGQSGSMGISSTHHPFTAPHPEDMHLLDTDRILEVRGLHYDLVMNGVEIGGGSIRIHSAALQRKVFQVLGMSEGKAAQFNHLLKVLESGCPPHGGFAMGFDRFVAMMCGKTSIRDVIAFPKTGSGSDPLIGSPSLQDAKTLEEYHIKVLEK